MAMHVVELNKLPGAVSGLLLPLIGYSGMAFVMPAFLLRKTLLTSEKGVFVRF